ncbi:MAG: DinB family protein [Chloroflexota bacterium]
MPHPLVTQLYFARKEFVRCIAGITADEAAQRLLPMNSISWIVGHLANQEQGYWLTMAQGKTPFPDLDQLVGYGQPASTPPITDMWATWDVITESSNVYLETLTTADLPKHITWQGGLSREDLGTMLLRNIHHYWFHTGEAHAIRQQLGHENLPDFVGDMSQFGYQSDV